MSEQQTNPSGVIFSTPSIDSVLYTNSHAEVSFTHLDDGQLLIGVTSGTPVAANLTAGTNVTIVNTHGGITISATGGGGGGTVSSNIHFVGNVGIANVNSSTDNFYIVGESPIETVASNNSLIISIPNYDFRHGTINNQMVTLEQGYSQGGFGGGAVGTNKTMSISRTDSFHLNSVSSYALGFSGSIFDGRYLYFVPFLDARTAPPPTNIIVQSEITRYDTTLSLDSSASYTVFNATAVDTFAHGYIGGVFDGQYVYFAPSIKDTVSFNMNGLTLRYNTLLDFTSSLSYQVFDLTVINSHCLNFAGSVFDGRFVYFIPSRLQPPTGILTRYDTRQSFTNSISYKFFDQSRLSPTFSNGFGAGGTFDGRYVYATVRDLSPSAVVRCDTTLDFEATTSYEVFQTSYQQLGFSVFDGRYVYYFPEYSTGSIVRYDSQSSFTSSGSYSSLNPLNIISSSYSAHFSGAVFDGRYITATPYTVENPCFLRYDTTKTFTDTVNYSVLDISSLITNTSAFGGAAWDGKYVYGVPGTAFGSSMRSSDYILRVEGYAGPYLFPMSTTTSGSSSSGAVNIIFDGNTGSAGVNTTSGIFNILGTAPIQTVATGSSAIISLTGISSGQLLIGTNTSPVAAYLTAGTKIVVSSSAGIVAISTDPRYGTINNQTAVLSQGYSQGGFGGGSVGTHKTVSTQTMDIFDLSSVTAITLFNGGVFDGRYCYLPAGGDDKILRYDTTKFISDTSGYNSITLTGFSASDSTFDGTYVYYPPGAGTTNFTRYDTRLNFQDSLSYQVFSLSNIQTTYSGAVGSVFDGRYVYLSPRLTDPSFAFRYDTTKSFVATSSYESFDLAYLTLSSANFRGGMYDGTYVYFPGVVSVRYNTSLPFAQTTSYESINLESSFGFSQFQTAGAVFDGRYAYFFSNAGDNAFLRYDVTLPFTATASYINSSLPVGFLFHSGAFDGRYVYLAPKNFGGSNLVIIDTTRKFTNYTTLSLPLFLGAGCNGVLFDGKSVYLVPFSSNKFFRFDGYPGPELLPAEVAGAGQLLIGTNAYPVAAYLTAGPGIVVSSSAGVIAISSTATFSLGVVSVDHGGTGQTILTSNAILYGNDTSPVGFVSLAAGQLVIGTNTSPVAAYLTAGSNVTVSSSAGIITISATSSPLPWTVVSADQTLAVNNGYFVNTGTRFLALPNTSSVGDVLEVSLAVSSASFRITQGASQQIRVGLNVTTQGAGGYMESTAVGDSVRLVCYVNNQEWITQSVIGSPTLV